MSVPGVAGYRREVVATVDCPDCGAAKGELCVKIGGGGSLGDEMIYVHDSRCCRHHLLATTNVVKLIGRVRPKRR